jgi:hypothetical protein
MNSGYYTKWSHMLHWRKRKKFPLYGGCFLVCFQVKRTNKKTRKMMLGKSRHWWENQEEVGNLETHAWWQREAWEASTILHTQLKEWIATMCLCINDTFGSHESFGYCGPLSESWMENMMFTLSQSISLQINIQLWKTKDSFNLEKCGGCQISQGVKAKPQQWGTEDSVT